MADLIGVTTCFQPLATIAYIVCQIAELPEGNRVSKDVELEGLDLPETGVPGYAGVVLDKQSETPAVR